MKAFTKPVNLNGSELLLELASIGIELDLKTQLPIVENDIIYLDIKDSDEEKVRKIVEVHNGTVVAPEPTINDKLASVGVNLDDLKSALGL